MESDLPHASEVSSMGGEGLQFPRNQNSVSPRLFSTLLLSYGSTTEPAQLHAACPFPNSCGLSCSSNTEQWFSWGIRKSGVEISSVMTSSTPVSLTTQLVQSVCFNANENTTTPHLEVLSEIYPLRQKQSTKVDQLQLELAVLQQKMINMEQDLAYFKRLNKENQPPVENVVHVTDTTLSYITPINKMNLKKKQN
ncbi:hypothetical protein HK096_004080 [Nowakowskiella sp. JEL0078]|nr:hypothetical protein HK096_004080 [Nowakowskiella sp. JEL0078]